MEKYPRLRAPRVTRGRASKCGRHPLVFFEPYLPAGVMATVYPAVSPSCSFVCPLSLHSFLRSLLPIISSSDGNDVIITTRPRRHLSLASIGQTVRAVDAPSYVMKGSTFDMGRMILFKMLYTDDDLFI